MSMIGQPLPLFVSTSPPDPGFGVDFYNPGKDSNTNFFDCFHEFSMYASESDLSALQSKLAVSDDQWAQLCSGSSSSSWEQLLTSTSGTELLSNLGTIFSSIASIDGFINTIISSQGNQETEQSWGYYDAQLMTSLIDVFQLPTQFSTEIVNNCTLAYQQMLDSTDMQDWIADLEDIRDASDFDKDTATSILASVKAYLEEAFGISIENIDAEFASALSGEDLDADKLDSLINKLMSGYLLDKTIELINSKSQSIDSAKSEVAEVEDELEMGSINPAILLVGANMVGQATSKMQQTQYKIRKHQDEKNEMENKKMEMKGKAKHHAEIRKQEAAGANKHASQKNNVKGGR